jgi:hypothetical protein
MRTLFVICIMVVVPPGVAVTQTAWPYQYVTDTSNRIIELSEATATPTPEAIEASASYACRALARLREELA